VGLTILIQRSFYDLALKNSSLVCNARVCASGSDFLLRFLGFLGFLGFLVVVGLVVGVVVAGFLDFLRLVVVVVVAGSVVVGSVVVGPEGVIIFAVA